MQLLEKYRQIGFINNQNLISLLTDIEVIEYTSLFKPSDVVRPGHTILIGRNIAVSDALTTMVNAKVRHFVQIGRNDFFSSLVAASTMIKTPNRFIANPVPYFLAGFRESPNPARQIHHLSMPFNSLRQRDTIFQQLEQFIKGHQKTKNSLDSVQTVADELMRNVIYHARVNKNQTPLYGPKDPEVPLSKDYSASLFIAHDGKVLLIGCEDVFGSIQYAPLMRTLLKSCLPGQFAPQEDRVGMGCKLMIDNSIGFYVVVRKHMLSLVCCSLQLATGKKKASQVPKNLHFCFYSHTRVA